MFVTSSVPIQPNAVIELTYEEAGALREILARTGCGSGGDAIRSVVSGLFDALMPWDVNTTNGPYVTSGNITISMRKKVL